MADPWLELKRIYDSAYYEGRGADPRVDFEGERRHPQTTIRRHEWVGIVRRVGSLVPLTAESTWLDYGCGLGGFVAFLHRLGYRGAIGFEPSPAARDLALPGVRLLPPGQLEEGLRQFDVVTAIDVMEHVSDPVVELTRMRTLLRPGGLLFVMTGNVQRHRNRVSSWRYVNPDFHISFFEPRTLAIAMEKAGLRPAFPGYGPGWTEILRYRVLKNLWRHRDHPLDGLVPWSVVCRVVDRWIGLSGQPVGWSPLPLEA